MVRKEAFRKGGRKMKKSNVMPSIVLGAICLTVALLLSVVNMFTAPRIAENKRKEEIKALKQVLTAGTTFDAIEITDAYPDVITGGYKSDAGYVFKAEVVGYQPGLTIMVGIDNDGKIAGVKHTASAETFGVEGELNQKYTDKKYDKESLEMILSASASKGAPMTAGAYYKAIDAALEAALIASGNKVEDIYPGVESVTTTDEGNYVFVAYADGFVGKIRIEISIAPDGKIVYVKTLSHTESDSYGAAVLDDPTFYEKFVGIESDTLNSVDNVAGVTGTSKGFKAAVKNAFDAFKAITEGGN